ncbi:MAG: hypothetical protein WBN85_02440 [Candidatus Macondimonas sp.]
MSTIGMHPAVGLAGMLVQPIQIKKATILIGKEAGMVVIAALDEVKRDIRQREEGAARHGKFQSVTSADQAYSKTVICPLLFLSSAPVFGFSRFLFPCNIAAAISAKVHTYEAGSTG